jgi:EAL domain-containing protein (putative c-di-GMP-specific phosphodiesterase class I)
MSVDSLERLQLGAELRHALERDEFILYYQPQVDLRTGGIVGAEALIRWKHREKGLMPPAKFISIIEKTGLIIPVGEWIIKTACRQAKEWQKLDMMPLRISVNLSAIQFNQKNLVDVIKKALATTRLSAEYLELELTESIVMQDVDEAIRKHHLLKNIGVSISIDDFGTGYSSLSYLKKFPIDVLKIDQSFIRDLSVDNDDAAIAAAVISMGHSLNMRIIAEGVEQKEHILFLREHDCDEIQGYYFSKPLPKEEFVTLLKSGKKLS